MLLKKIGFPEEDEIVMCTVTSVQYHSVFCNLNEYGRTGIIHISEVSPGRIRNIRDYVKEGKVVICKILRVNKEKGHIDLSLRRVNESQRRNKVNEIKQEQKAEKIVEFVAKEMKIPVDRMFKDIYEKTTQKFDTMYESFEAVVEAGKKLVDLGIDAKTAEKLEKIIKQRIKPVEVSISGEFTITSHAPDGVNIIKSALEKAEKTDKNIAITYEGGGKYHIKVVSPNYKGAEKIMKKAGDSVIKTMDKSDGEAEFARQES